MIQKANSRQFNQIKHKQKVSINSVCCRSLSVVFIYQFIFISLNNKCARQENQEIRLVFFSLQNKSTNVETCCKTCQLIYFY